MQVVNKNNAHKGMLVVRGPHWEYGDQDFYPGNVGVVYQINGDSASVRWQSKEGVEYKNTYRIGKQSDLCVAGIISLEYPEAYTLKKGDKIKILDTQGSSNVVQNDIYEFVQIDQINKMTLNGPTGLIEWFCMGNSHGHYFKLEPSEKPVKAPERDIEKIKFGTIGISSTNSTGHISFFDEF